MVRTITLRQALPRDFAFCQRLYFDTMGWIIAALHLDVDRHRTSFANQWCASRVRIIRYADRDVGWLLTAIAADAVVLEQFYVDARFQRQGIGSHVLRMLIGEAAEANKAVSLGVVKINPVRSLYERFGFHPTHED